MPSLSRGCQAWSTMWPPSSKYGAMRATNWSKLIVSSGLPRGACFASTETRARRSHRQAPLDAPDADAAVTTPLLQDPGLACARRAPTSARRCSRVSSRWTSLPQPISRVSTSTSLVPSFMITSGCVLTKHAGGRDFTQHGVERSARMPGLDRIDPDQRAVEPEQLVAQLARLRQVVDRRVRVDATCARRRRIRRRSGCSRASQGDGPRGRRDRRWRSAMDVCSRPPPHLIV